MATFDYTNLNSVARRLLIKFGTTVSVSRPGSSVTWVKKYDPVEQRIYWEHSTTFVKVYVAPAETEVVDAGICVISKFEDQDIDGTLIKQGDLLLIAKDIIEPMSGDIYTVAGVDYKYVTHKNIAPDGASIVYRIQVRI